MGFFTLFKSKGKKKNIRAECLLFSRHLIVAAKKLSKILWRKTCNSIGFLRCENAAPDALLPALFYAIHWYWPKSSIFTSVIKNFYPFRIIPALRLDSEGYEALSFIHEGWPCTNSRSAIESNIGTDQNALVWIFNNRWYLSICNWLRLHR